MSAKTTRKPPSMKPRQAQNAASASDSHPWYLPGIMPSQLFVYGTLRPGGSLYPGIESLVEAHQPAFLPGFDLHMAGYPAVRPSAFFTARVRGDLLLLKNPAAALALCDRIERYNPPEITMYIRAVVPVWGFTQPGVAVPAWVYLGGPGLRYAETNRVESGDFADVIPLAVT